jgi:hypothetical protein
MRTYVVMTYDSAQKPIGEFSGEFASMDVAVATLSGLSLIRVGNQADLRAVAWEAGKGSASVKVAYYLAQFVGADSE